jgi:hypothetical protein
MKRFYRLTPHFRLNNNPLFALEVRRVRRGESAKSLIDYSLLIVAVICASGLLLWLFLALSSGGSRQSATLSDYFLILFGFSLLATLTLDYVAMTSSIGSISSEITAGRWDLLRLTAMESKAIVAAKYGAAQVRAWRTMVLIVGLRIAVVLMAGITTVMLVVSELRRFMSFDIPLPAMIMLLIAAAACAVFYIVEPFWRMLTVTAMGLAVSARVGHAASSVVFGVGALAAFWLAQSFVAFALLLIVGIIIAPLASVEVLLVQGVICSPLLFLGVVGVTIYGFYSVVHSWGLRRALNFATRLDLNEHKVMAA